MYRKFCYPVKNVISTLECPLLSLSTMLSMIIKKNRFIFQITEAIQKVLRVLNKFHFSIPIGDGGDGCVATKNFTTVKDTQLVTKVFSYSFSHCVIGPVKSKELLLHKKISNRLVYKGAVQK